MAEPGVAKDASPEVEQLRLERDLYLGLLNLSGREEPGAFLEEALRLIVKVLNAEQAYLEVSGEEEGPGWWRTSGCTDEQGETIRAIVSRGIIAEALAHGEAIVSPSAILDPRFRDRKSVRASKIEAVLCVPIVKKTPIGVLYLQGRRAGGAFSDEEVERAKLLGRHLAPLVDGLVARSSRSPADHVARFRQRLRLDAMVGRSEALAAVLREVELVAPLEIAVLITGETGSGKTQLAHVIHENGARRGHPFLEINCASIPENLVESALFGAVRGAYTDAEPSKGIVGAAAGGTLLLDEIGELSDKAQAKLLQFLQTKTYFPVGSPTALRADVRVVAATNADLQSAVDERRFRSDLFFRLNVLTIRLPSLAERPDDIALLARSLCERAQREHGLRPLELSPGAIRAIEAAAWPGNVRELGNAVQAAAIRASAEEAAAIEAAHVFRSSAPPAAGSARPPATFHEETRRFQSTLVQRALEASEWNVTAAAKALDLTRAHLHNLIKAYGLSRGRGPQ
jgi:Nif-specific regulatory protein